jgi:acyl-CoA reductase-like NAD-dependent aldehyde dehydrogenase
VQVAQALAAGNAVVLKPAPGRTAAARALQSLFLDAGLEPGLLTVLPEDVEAVREFMSWGVDKVLLTGSAATGRAVLGDLASCLTPATVELSGCDAVFVRPDADLDRVVKALRFGLTFSGSRTCIAPRRAFVPAALRGPLVERLHVALEDARPFAVDARTRAQVERLVDAACAEGARVAVGTRPGDGSMRPLVLEGVRPDMELAQSDVFAPVLSILDVADDDDALQQAAACPYALGATVFGGTRGAAALADRVRAGVVIVNDMIAPTADPRVPFGGRGESGYGVTRGAEGLLALTAPKAVIVKRGRTPRHLEPMRGGEERLFRAWLRAVHAPGWRARLAGVRELMREGVRYARRAREEEGSRDEPDA